MFPLILALALAQDKEIIPVRPFVPQGRETGMKATSPPIGWEKRGAYWYYLDYRMPFGFMPRELQPKPSHSEELATKIKSPAERRLESVRRYVQNRLNLTVEDLDSTPRNALTNNKEPALLYEVTARKTVISTQSSLWQKKRLYFTVFVLVEGDRATKHQFSEDMKKLTICKVEGQK